MTEKIHQIVKIISTVKPIIFVMIGLMALVSCEDKWDDSNSIPYQSEMDDLLGTWTLTYFTSGKIVDTLILKRNGNRLRSTYNGKLIFPALEKNKLEFRVDSEPRKRFDGKLMGSRLWGTMRFEKGDYALQRLQWEGQRIN